MILERERTQAKLYRQTPVKGGLQAHSLARTISLNLCVEAMLVALPPSYGPGGQPHRDLNQLVSSQVLLRKQRRVAWPEPLPSKILMADREKHQFSGWRLTLEPIQKNDGSFLYSLQSVYINVAFLQKHAIWATVRAH